MSDQIQFEADKYKLPENSGTGVIILTGTESSDGEVSGTVFTNEGSLDIDVFG